MIINVKNILHNFKAYESEGYYALSDLTSSAFVN